MFSHKGLVLSVVDHLLLLFAGGLPLLIVFESSESKTQNDDNDEKDKENSTGRMVFVAWLGVRIVEAERIRTDGVGGGSNVGSSQIC